MEKENYKVLMIDDDEMIATATSEYFNMFGVKTAYVTTYDAAVAFLDENEVSLVLLDINLGDKSGFDLCRKIRENYDLPIFFISARTSDDDVLIALNIGGDDYIKKPYTLSVLLAKVKAAAARYDRARENTAAVKGVAQTDEGLVKLIGDIYLNTNIHKIISDGKEITLKALEYKLLYYLYANRGKVVSKDDLLRDVWEDEYINEGTIAVHIRHLREKIEPDPKEPQLIKTVWGVGYIMEETVS
ncbi:response regulator transcription factor [uncultured Ruminococcus sp.]|uniref:response regulator transcription factor n=1 Tax=uncultured Ruminococcus sp. TaxID=165186 RepID=UPI0025D9D2D3|nr:response regulator transcription factor [uncultured Ruminococcus sp.]